MDWYVDLDIHPVDGLTVLQVLESLMQRLHSRLASGQVTGIGLSLPRHDPAGTFTGNVLRVHGQRPALEALLASAWLQPVREHLQQIGPAPVPPGARHRIVYRRQSSANVGARARRAARRQQIPMEEAQRRYEQAAEGQMLALPHVFLFSSKTKQVFPLFIEHGPILSEPQEGVLGSYGLSSHASGGAASVPWF